MKRTASSPDAPESPATTAGNPRRYQDDWWSVVVLLLGVVLGSALVLYVLVEWFAGA